MINFAAIDFETANHKHSSICSLGIVIVENGIITDKIYRLIRPQPNFYCSWATDIHGLSYYDTLNEPEFPEVWKNIKPKLTSLPLVAHNSSFDANCLKAVHDLYGIQYPNYEFHCTYRMAKRKFPNLENHQLHTVAKHIGYDLGNHHHALADAEACAEIAKIII
ncbi:DNA polymerase-3 subunit epsilon [Dysgonomonadaceae bacterium PH5-43]|nr:DNA polymerase-3 subunit epsilon [Dysgonomonadaceae bacterium PH5-43]